MTVAVAVFKKNHLVIGADTQTNFGDNSMTSNDYKASKILTINGTYVASTGWALYDNIFKDLLLDKKNKNVKLNNEESVFKFFNNLYFTVKEKYSYVNNQCNESSTPFADLDARFLIANRNGIFYVTAMMSVHKFERYYAIGAGGDYALGALQVLYDSNLSAKEICQKAILAAISLNIRCGGQPDIYEIKL